jgi:hypothetical protein
VLVRQGAPQHGALPLAAVVDGDALAQRRLILGLQLDVPKVAGKGDAIVDLGRRDAALGDLAKRGEALPQVVWANAWRQAAHEEPDHGWMCANCAIGTR